LLYTIIAFGVLVILSLLLTPALIAFMFPNANDDLFDDDDESMGG